MKRNAKYILNFRNHWWLMGFYLSVVQSKSFNHKSISLNYLIHSFMIKKINFRELRDIRRYLTVGAAHDKQLTKIIEGVPSHMPLLKEDIDASVLRRQKGHGRGRRMQIEKDLVEVMSGVRHGYTLGSPISLVVTNDDFKSWVDIMGEDPIEED